MKKSTKFFGLLAAAGAIVGAYMFGRTKTLDELKKEAEQAGQRAVDLANKYRDRLRASPPTAPVAPAPAPGTAGAPLDPGVSGGHR